MFSNELLELSVIIFFLCRSSAHEPKHCVWSCTNVEVEYSFPKLSVVNIQLEEVR